MITSIIDFSSSAYFTVQNQSVTVLDGNQAFNNLSFVAFDF